MTFAKLKTGQKLMSRAVNDLVAVHKSFALIVFQCLTRHTHCNWGDCCEEDQTANDDALKNGLRVFSVYHLPKEYNNIHTDTKIWIITEADRSSTTILFPSDY